MSIKWPETVPVLTAKDICKGHLAGPHGSHCLGGWAQVAFGVNLMVQPLRDAAPTVFRAIKAECGTERYTAFNDNPKTPKKTIAAVWNRAMKRLGYTEIIN